MTEHEFNVVFALAKLKGAVAGISEAMPHLTMPELEARWREVLGLAKALAEELEDEARRLRGLPVPRRSNRRRAPRSGGRPPGAGGGRTGGT